MVLDRKFNVDDKVVILKLPVINDDSNPGWKGYYERGQLKEGNDGIVKGSIIVYDKPAYLIELTDIPGTSFCLQEDYLIKKAEGKGCPRDSRIKDNLDFVKHIVKIARECGVRDKLDYRICKECEHFEGYCHFPWWIEYTFEDLLKMYSSDNED